MAVGEENELVDTKPKSAPNYRLDSKFFKRFKLCLGIIFPNVLSDSSLMMSVLLGLSIGQQLVIFNVGLLPSEFIQVLGNKNKSDFKSLLAKAISLIVTISVFNSACTSISGYLHVHWRNHLTRYLHRKYFQNSTHYFLDSGHFSTHIDNVDQRMTQDVDRFSLSLSGIVGKIIISPLVIVYYSYKCFKSNGATGPLIIYAYFFIGTFINKLIMSLIVNLVYLQEQREGDFRFKHVTIRSLSESIAFAESEAHEYSKATQLLLELLKVQRRIVNNEILLNLSTNFIDYLGAIISYMIISVPIFAGKYDNLPPVDLIGIISKNAFISMYLISCFSTLVDLSTNFTDMSGYAHRIGELIEIFNAKKNCEKRRFLQPLCLTERMESQTLCVISNLTYTSPTSNKLLVSGLNLNIHHQQNLLIIGSTGVGKSSLLRIIKGIWKPLSGTVKFNSSLKDNLNIMYLPQISILTNGSLLEQIIYPILKKNITNRERVFKRVKKCLDDVGLYHLISRIGELDLDPCWNWSQKLSPGEIQRISFARLFFHKPRLAFLDEATSSIGISEEECFYRYCELLDITYVSVGHRDTLKAYHQSYLKIRGDGTWEFGEL